MNPKVRYLVLSLIAAIALGITFTAINYVGKEGFNPSDDGVILAQSWRILNGEVPHKDFIAMKPALSGFLHIIHFFSPIPLEDSARWFVVFQNFIVSFLWVYLLVQAFWKDNAAKISNGLVFITVSLIAFTMNLNHHGLFPWTTVDGLFWAIIGTSLFVVVYSENIATGKKMLFALSGIFFMSLAFLSRQTFGFGLFLLDLLALVHFLKLKKYLQLIAILVLGQLPVIIYLIYLFKQGALALFVSQLSGRTEFVEVGLFQYLKSFLKSRLALLNLPIFLYLGWFVLKNLKNFQQNRKNVFNSVVSGNSVIVSVIAIGWLILCCSLSVNMLVVFDPMNQANPFELFFLMLSITLFVIIIFPLSNKQGFLLALSLLLCWICSLSLGSNSPAYCLGIVCSTNLVLCLFILFKLDSNLSARIARKLAPVLISLSIFIFILGTWMQSRINYRDKPASQLECKLGKIIPSMGRTLTNTNLCNYYSEFLNIYNSIPGMKDHFLILPNNAMIYPALRSRNPFPLDWAQHDEYIGQEERVFEMMKKVLNEEDIYILIDKYNVEGFAYGLFPVDYVNLASSNPNDLFVRKYRVFKYDYMNLILKYCKEMPANYKYFHLYTSRKSIQNH